MFHHMHTILTFRPDVVHHRKRVLKTYTETVEDKRIMKQKSLTWRFSEILKIINYLPRRAEDDYIIQYIPEAGKKNHSCKLQLLSVGDCVNTIFYTWTYRNCAWHDKPARINHNSTPPGRFQVQRPQVVKLRSTII